MKQVTLTAYCSALLLTYCAAYGLWLIFHWGGATITAHLAGTPTLVPSVFALGATLYRVFQEPAGNRRRGWSILAVALGLYGIGLSIWSYDTVVYAQIPFPTIADALFLMFPWLLILALARLTTSSFSRFDKMRVLLNTLTLVVSLSLIEWVLLLRHTVGQAGSTLIAVTALLYPLGDLVMLGGVMFTLQHLWSGDRSLFLRLLMGAVLLFVVGDSLYAAQVAVGTYHAATLLDLTWAAGLALFGVAALHPRPSEGDSTVRLERMGRQDLTSGIILFSTLGASAALLPLLSRSDLQAADVVITVGSLLALGLLGFFRQRLDSAENGLLHQHLQDTNNGLNVGIDLAVAELKSRNDDLNRQARLLESNSRNSELSRNMADLLQACMTLEEMRDVIVQAAAALFPETQGAFAILNPARTLLEPFASWGEVGGQAFGQAFEPQRCWSLRRGHQHVAERDGQEIKVTCDQVKGSVFNAYLCLPMIAQGETFGVLRLMLNEGSDQRIEDLQLVAQGVARQVALAIANLQLRESLRVQSIRDVLTGLYNRRYFEETLKLNIHLADRGRLPLSVMMLDVDHFKSFNDTFGHEAGDIVLQELGKVMLQTFRAEDVTCRFGGEEFVVLMLGSTGETAVAKAERLRQAIHTLDLRYHEQNLGTVTVSVGVATLDHKEKNAESLIRTADQALYQAKQEGRNRVIQAVPA